MVRSSLPRWPIGSTGAIWLVLALIVGHYAVMFGIGGTLALLLGLKRGEIWQAPPAAFVVIIAVGIVEVWLVLVVGMKRIAQLTFHDAGWRDRTLRDVGYGLLGLAVYVFIIAAIITAELGDAGAAMCSS
jgi:hypothetical protein